MRDCKRLPSRSVLYRLIPYGPQDALAESYRVPSAPPDSSPCKTAHRENCLAAFTPKLLPWLTALAPSTQFERDVRAYQGNATEEHAASGKGAQGSSESKKNTTATSSERKTTRWVFARPANLVMNNPSPEISPALFPHPPARNPVLRCYLKDACLIQTQEGSCHHLRQALRAVLDDLKDGLETFRTAQ